MDNRRSMVGMVLLLAAVAAGCGARSGPKPGPAPDIPPGFEVRAEQPGALQVLTFRLPGSALTCSAFTGTRLTHLGWTSSLPPVAELTPIAIAAEKGGRADIYLVAPDGSWVERVTDGPVVGLHPAWSPDGTQLAFARYPEPPDIWIMDAAGGRLNRVTKTAEHSGAAAWSPDGRRLALRRGESPCFDIHTVGVDGTDWRQLTDNPHFDRGAEWSPDGSRIVFASDRTGNYEIYTMDADGGNVRQITNEPHLDLAPAWSPDGQRILFSSNRYRGMELYVMEVDGSNVERLTTETGKASHADWSPDGRRICYRCWDAEGAELRVMDADGSDARTLVGEPYEVICTAWITRRSKRTLIGSPGEDAGFDPPLGARALAAAVVYDDRSIRSAVGVTASDGAAVKIHQSRGGQGHMVLDIGSREPLCIVESVWMGQPPTRHLEWSDGVAACRICFDATTGRVESVTPE